VKQFNLADKQELQKLFHGFGISPQKKLSQNFLVDQQALEEIVAAADVQTNDLVIEVGAGTGILTRELAGRAKKVLAIEYDKEILPLLKSNLVDYPRAEIVFGDIMQFSIPELLSRLGREKNLHYKIIANLPYHLTSHFIKKFLDTAFPPSSLTLLLQKEVGIRICAKPGQMSLLSLSVQIFGIPSIVAFVPKTAFWPQPKVDSAIINIRRRAKLLINEILRKKLFLIAKAAFAARRKTLANALSGNLKQNPSEIKEILHNLGLSPLVRAQELSLEQWSCLVDKIRQ